MFSDNKDRLIAKLYTVDDEIKMKNIEREIKINDYFEKDAILKNNLI
jgi:hypothetical protein